MRESLTIDLFTDIICPWCLIGTAHLDAALASLDPDLEVLVRHHPFLLDPTIPDEGWNTKQRLAAKYGGDIDAMQARVEQAARNAGVALDLSVQPMSYPTIRAHTLIRLAPEPVQYPLAKAMAAAYFLEGQNIAEDAVLREIALAHGFSQADADRVLGDAAEHRMTQTLARAAGEKGITGVPFFIFDGQLALSGAQPVEIFAQVFERVLSSEPASI